MIDVEDALELILSNTPTMAVERLPLCQATGRVSAAVLHSPIDLPLFDSSAVDGYALAASTENKESEWHLVTTVPAGGTADCPLRDGQAARVFTGSPIPQGTAAVVMQEDVRIGNDNTIIASNVSLGSHVRRKGEEISAGDLLFQAGTLMMPPVLSAIASVGIPTLDVYAQPRVTVIATGSELASPGEQLKPGQIFASNGLAISGAVSLAGCTVERVLTVPDHALQVEEPLREALTSDVIITCGGVSVGSFDYVRPAAEKVGLREVFWKVAMRPGMPFYFALGPQGQLLFGLPGNPVSALVTYLVLVLPAIRKMQGHGHCEPSFSPAMLTKRLSKKKGRQEYVRAKGACQSSDVLQVTPLEKQGSHMLTGLASAEYLIVLPKHGEVFEAGHFVRVQRINWGLS